jgi:hypothetical protein
MFNVIELIYRMRAQIVSKETVCPKCGLLVTSIVVTKNKVVFRPCKCVWATITELSAEEMRKDSIIHSVEE